MAERVGFEPTLRYKRRPLFESGTINHSDTSPKAKLRVFQDFKKRFATNLLLNIFRDVFIMPYLKCIVKPFGCCLLQSRRYMGISIQRD